MRSYTRLKLTFLFLSFFSVSTGTKAAGPSVKRDSLLKILQINDTRLRQRQLVLYIRYYFGDVPDDQLTAVKTEAGNLLERYQVTDRVAIGQFMETLCLMQLRQYRPAEKALVSAIALADQNDDDYLLYACFTHLGFIQTYQGEVTEAISSFRLAKK